LAETELKIDHASGRAALDLLAKDAKKKGYLLISHKAAVASGLHRTIAN
jgi:hypothetical protein